MYPNVPDEDQEMFSLLSDVQRNKYMKELEKKTEPATKQQVQPKTAGVPRPKKASLKASGKFRYEQEERDESEEEDMPELVESSESDFEVEEEFPSRQRQARREKAASKKATNADPKTPAPKQSKPKQKKPRKAAPAASNMKRNVTQHPFISRPPLDVGAPVFSGFVSGVRQPVEEESEEEALTLNRVRPQREQLDMREKLGVDNQERLLGSPVSNAALRAQSKRGRKPKVQIPDTTELECAELTEENESDIEYVDNPSTSISGGVRGTIRMGGSAEEKGQILADEAADLCERGCVPNNTDRYTFVPRQQGDSTFPVESIPTFGFKVDKHVVGDRKGFGAGTVPSELCSAEDTPFGLVLKHIGGEESIMSWVEETNYRANQFFANGKALEEEKQREKDYEPAEGDNWKKKKLYGRMWTDITYIELMMWIGICLMMVVIGLANESDYWSATAYGLYPAMNFYKQTGMSFKRWKQIKRFFNCQAVRPEDFDNDPTSSRYKKLKDKLHRCRPFINTLNRIAKVLVRAGMKWSVDESIIPYFGMFCPIKVYMKDKPHKFGMKLWGLWDAITGYCLAFHVYEGRGDRWEGESNEWIDFWNLGERVILGFTRWIPTGSFVFTDRFFTTPRVAAYLRDLYNIFLTGTLMKNVKGLDKDIVFKKTKNIARGFYKWSYDSVCKVIQVCWLDRNPVLMLSSMLSALPVSGLKRLTWSQEKGYAKQDMQAPEMTREYNKDGMGGGDLCDRMKLARRTSCELNLVSNRWDWRLFWGLWDIAVVNCFIIFLFFHPTCTHAQFFLEVANGFYFYGKKGAGGDKRKRTSPRTASELDLSHLTLVSDADDESDVKVPDVTPLRHVRRRFKGSYKRSCFVCLKLDRNKTQGKKAKESGDLRWNYPRSYSGCKTCNVALCVGGDCWTVHHRDYLHCRQNWPMKYWDNTDAENNSDTQSA